MGGSTYLPLKVNQAGVILIIFATSVLYFPVLIASVYHGQWFSDFVNKYVQNQRSILYMFILASLIVFFSYFYTAIQFDPVRTADNLRQQGGFIPGIRPGAAHGRLPQRHPRPHHAARLALPRGHRPDPDDRPRDVELPAVPVRRYVDS